MDVQKAFGKKVRQLRTEKGLSQEKFALLIGMDRTYLASVEAGKRNISIRNIQKIVSAQHCGLFVFPPQAAVVVVADFFYHAQGPGRSSEPPGAFPLLISPLHTGLFSPRFPPCPPPSPTGQRSSPCTVPCRPRPPVPAAWSPSAAGRRRCPQGTLALPSR